MKIKLKYKLILIYTTLIAILIALLILVSNNIFSVCFENYIVSNREEKSKEIVDKVLLSFQENGEPNYDELYEIGIDALNDGLILMVNTDYNNQIICISDVIPNESNLMLERMENTLHSIYPHMNGSYEEDRYILQDESNTYGYVTLGYYGPIYYTEFDALFLNAVRRGIYIVGVIFFFVTTAIVYVLASKISKPIYKVSKKAKDLSFGNYKDSIDIDSSTEEIQNLIDSINHLAHSLETQQQVKKQLAANYTHEIRTPLTCVLTTLEGMKEGFFDVTDERLDSLYTEINRISNMVTDVDKLIETSDFDVVLNKTSFDFDLLIKNSINSFESLFISKDIQIDYKNLCKDGNRIFADEEKIKSLVLNLISNSLKYTDKGGRVDISLEKNKNNYELIVKDNGIGIEETELDLIFEHMYRVEKSRVKEVDGFGIGLAICKNVALAHKGTIEVKSVIGEGSEFKLLLPINKEEK